MSHLARLISARMEEMEWSFADVAERAGRTADGKPALARSTVHNWVKRPANLLPPKPSKLDALAKALQLPRDVVHHAAALDAGYNLQSAADTPTTLAKAENMRIIADLAQDLSADQLDEIRRIAEREAQRLMSEEKNTETGQ